jgi:hypothetical protein
MLIYHYNQYYRFFLSSEKISAISEEDAAKGLEIPAWATTIKPPLENCKKGQIPVFKNRGFNCQVQHR